MNVTEVLLNHALYGNSDTFTLVYNYTLDSQFKREYMFTILCQFLVGIVFGFIAVSQVIAWRSYSMMPPSYTPRVDYKHYFITKILLFGIAYSILNFINLGFVIYDGIGLLLLQIFWYYYRGYIPSHSINFIRDNFYRYVDFQLQLDALGVIFSPYMFQWIGVFCLHFWLFTRERRTVLAYYVGYVGIPPYRYAGLIENGVLEWYKEEIILYPKLLLVFFRGILGG